MSILATDASTTGGFTEDAFHRFMKGRDEPAWLVDRRREAFARFQAFPWPAPARRSGAGPISGR